MSSSAGISLNAVRRQFDRRAASAADADFLHREIERRMLERLDLVRRSPAAVLDVGCGAGAGVRALRERHPDAFVVGLDLSPARVRAAARAQAAGAGRLDALASRLRDRMPGRLAEAIAGRIAGAPGGALLAGDMQRLPLASARFDLVWSNLALHWCPDIGAALAEWSRVLRGDGLLMFSAYGVDTLAELRTAGLATPTFPDLHDLGDALVHSGFSDPVMDMEKIVLTWLDADRALADLRTLGGNALAARFTGLRGRGWGERIRERLAALRDASGRIVVTVEIVQGHAWCSPASKLPAGTAPLRFVPSRR